LKGIKYFKAWAILLIVFLVPVFFILFLKYCGENHYAVTVFYRHGVEHPGNGCRYDTGQYRINSFPFVMPSGLSCDTSAIRGKFTVLSVQESSSPKRKEQLLFNLQRVLDDLNRPDIVQAYIIAPDDSTGMAARKDQGVNAAIRHVKGNRSDVSLFARCGLILPADSINDKMVLADRQGRIRGYYDASRFDEFERLEIELRILLKEMGYEK
jgi:protein SCO1/2